MKMKRMLLLLSLSLLSCKEELELSNRLGVLENEMLALREENAALKQRLEKIMPIFEVLSRNEEGDLIVEGVDLLIQNGTGKSWISNGKGNLILGYNEEAYDDETSFCEGGRNDGQSCDDNRSCPDGFCQGTVISKRTGSHNIVVGPEHSYEAGAGVVTGSRNHVKKDNGCIIGGTKNIVDSEEAAIIGGLMNNAAGGASVIVGGYKNTTEGPSSSTVVAGGYEQSGSDSRSPIIGDWGKMISDLHEMVWFGRLSYLGLVETIEEKCRCN